MDHLPCTINQSELWVIGYMFEQVWVVFLKRPHKTQIRPKHPVKCHSGPNTPNLDRFSALLAGGLIGMHCISDCTLDTTFGNPHSSLHIIQTYRFSIVLSSTLGYHKWFVDECTSEWQMVNASCCDLSCCTVVLGLAAWYYNSLHLL